MIYDILIDLKTKSETILNECFVGSVWEVEKKSRKYPLMVIDPEVKSHTFKDSSMNINLDIYLVDLTYEQTDDYILRLQSDLAKIGVDFIRYIGNDKYYIDFRENQSIIMFQDKWDDDVSGVKIETTLKIIDNTNCYNVFTDKLIESECYYSLTMPQCHEDPNTVIYAEKELIELETLDKIYKFPYGYNVMDGFYLSGSYIFSVVDSVIIKKEPCPK
jgi:hypothetical protein